MEPVVVFSLNNDRGAAAGAIACYGTAPGRRLRHEPHLPGGRPPRRDLPLHRRRAHTRMLVPDPGVERAHRDDRTALRRVIRPRVERTTIASRRALRRADEGGAPEPDDNDLPTGCHSACNADAEVHPGLLPVRTNDQRYARGLG